MQIKITEAGFAAGAHHEKDEILEVSERQANTAIRRGRAEFKHSEPEPTKPNKESLKTQLDAAEISYRENASLTVLQKLVDELEADPTL